MARPRALLAFALVLAATGASAQPVPAARIAVLLAEDRRAPTARDVATLRTAARGSDSVTARIALRALGRLERPDVIADILPGLRHSLPELRAEAANAVGQAARGWLRSAGTPADGARKPTAGATTPAAALTTLIAALEPEEEPSVRAAICETIGRLPYTTPDDAARAERALLAVHAGSDAVTDRLGVAKGFEVFVRTTQTLRPPGAEAIAAMRALAGLPDSAADLSTRSPAAIDPLRDARVRRLALESLTTIKAADAALLRRAAADADPQVRRLAMRSAATAAAAADILDEGMNDPAAMVRLEALRAIRVSRGAGACAASLDALSDQDPHVALLGIDQLAVCGDTPDAATRLTQMVNELPDASSPHGWHRAAHAIVALAAAAPERAGAALPPFVKSAIWQMRAYAARAAAELRQADLLMQLAADPHDNVVETAIDGLVKVGGHDHDAIYTAALSRSGYQVIRAAAIALNGSPNADVVAGPLTATLHQLIAEGSANSLTTRAALSATLTGLGVTPPKAKEPPSPQTPVTSDDLRRLAAPLARVTIRGVGRFDIVLFTSEAPLTVLRFARLAESGYYDGLTFHRLVPNFVLQGGSPAASEYVGEPTHMRDEVGLWPHVRGTVGISTRGRDTGDAQFFVNLVDNPRFDHEYTVFAQVLNGIEVIDQILEGDVIERVEIVP
jgi:cyclophilin family peptidyl-prolyl cis-trans isomerase